ncbi:MAG: aminoacyl-tRNA hydrolase [Sphingomonadales bacterium]|nr:aminoacyl-tRNA hydrolase [Sphingomonadales bacterium]
MYTACHAVQLPEDLIEETFLASTGPGGQNVNKGGNRVPVAGRCFPASLPPYAFRKLKTLAGSKMTAAGELVVTAREHRTREANRAEAGARINRLIDQAFVRKLADQDQAEQSSQGQARRGQKGRAKSKKGRGKSPA